MLPLLGSAGCEVRGTEGSYARLLRMTSSGWEQRGGGVPRKLLLGGREPMLLLRGGEGDQGDREELDAGKGWEGKAGEACRGGDSDAAAAAAAAIAVGMDKLEARVASFSGGFPMDLWPLTPDRLARSGFYHSPTDDHPDRAACHSCHVALHSWEQLDHPSMQHLRWARGDCEFIRETCGDLLAIMASHPLASPDMLRPPPPFSRCIAMSIRPNETASLDKAASSPPLLRPVRISLE